MKMKSKSTISEVYKLPSLGKLYGEGFPEEVTIRSMTTLEEKMRLGNQGFYKTITTILDSVVTSPENFESKYMTLFDFNFLMYKMRAVSYGPTYKVTVTCPDCGKSQVVRVNLDDLKVDYLQDDAVEPFKIGPLPRSGDTLTCRYLRVTDLMSNQKKSDEIISKNPDYQGDPSYILDLCSRIMSINDEEITPYEVQMYVEEMSAMDSQYFTQAYNKYVNKVGMDNSCETTCEYCGSHIDFTLPFNSEFFRPTYDI